MASPLPPAKGPVSPQERVVLFRRLFRGGDEVYDLRWLRSSGWRSGFCTGFVNEWKPGICGTQRVACRDSSHRQLRSLTEAAIYGHLAGAHTVGPYPLQQELGIGELPRRRRLHRHRPPAARPATAARTRPLA